MVGQAAHFFLHNFIGIVVRQRPAGRPADRIRSNSKKNTRSSHDDMLYSQPQGERADNIIEQGR